MEGVLSSKSIPESEKREVGEVAFPGKIAAWGLWIWRIFKYVVKGSSPESRERRRE
jgi:hypothetical protein